MDYDNAGVASSVVFDPYGNYLFVALETSREVAVVDVFGRRELLRVAVGRAPQGLAVSPDGTRLYVNNFMDRSVSVLDIGRLDQAGQQQRAGGGDAGGGGEREAQRAGAGGQAAVLRCQGPAAGA